MSSPIETALREALLRMAPAQYILVDGTGHPSAIPEKWGDFDNVARWVSPIILLDEPEHKRAIYLYSAVSVLTYRVDFLLEFSVLRLAIECDGHEFHDRTKQQAAYDRARDRELMRLGIATIRFTGSEIVHSPERCADEAYRCLLGCRTRAGHTATVGTTPCGSTNLGPASRSTGRPEKPRVVRQ